MYIYQPLSLCNFQSVAEIYSDHVYLSCLHKIKIYIRRKVVKGGQLKTLIIFFFRLFARCQFFLVALLLCLSLASSSSYFFLLGKGVFQNLSAEKLLFRSTTGSLLFARQRLDKGGSLTVTSPSLSQFQFSQIITVIWQLAIHAPVSKRVISFCCGRFVSPRETVTSGRVVSEPELANVTNCSKPENTQKWTKRRLRKNWISGSSSSMNASSCPRDK